MHAYCLYIVIRIQKFAFHNFVPTVPGLEMRCCLHSFTSSAMTMFDIGRLALNVSDCKKHLLLSLGLSLLCSFVSTFTIVVLVWRGFGECSIILVQ